MGYFSAQLDENSIVKAVTDTTGPLQGANIVSLQTLDYSLVGMSYTGSSFVPVPLTEEQINQQAIQAEMLRLQNAVSRQDAIANLIASSVLPANYTE